MPCRPRSSQRSKRRVDLPRPILGGLSKKDRLVDACLTTPLTGSRRPPTPKGLRAPEREPSPGPRPDGRMALEILRERDLAERPVRRDGNGATAIADGPRRHTPSGTARLPEVHRGVHLRRGTIAPPAHRGVHVTGAADSDDSDRPQERRPPAVRGRGAPARGRKLRLALRPARAPRSGQRSTDPCPGSDRLPPRGSVKDRTMSVGAPQPDRRRACSRASSCMPPRSAGGGSRRPAHARAVDRASKIR